MPRLPQRVRAARILAILLATVIAAAGCSGAGSEATPTPSPAPSATPAVPFPDRGASVYGGVLRAWISQAPATPDLAQRRDPNAWQVLLPMMDWLIAFEQGRDGLIPDLALSWEQPTAFSYMLHLRPNVRWHDGTPFTASDAAAALNRLADPGGVAPYRKPLASLSHVAVTDSTTLSLTLSRPDPLFLPGLGALGNVIARPSNPDTSTPIGTGPFKMARNVPQVRLELERNDSYFGRDRYGRALPLLSGITFVEAGEFATGFALLRQRLVDLSWAQPIASYGATAQQAAERLRGLGVLPFPGASYLLRFPNTQPWRDPALRLAIARAFDRAAFNEQASFGRGDPLTFLLPSASMGGRWALPSVEIAALPGYSPPAPATSPIPGLPESLIILAADTHAGAAQALFNQLRPALGPQARLSVQPFAAIVAARISLQFDLLLDTTAAWLDDPSTALEPLFRTGAPDNAGRWSDPGVDLALDQIARTAAAGDRLLLAHALQRELAQRAWIIVLGAEPHLAAFRPEVRGLWRPLHLEDGPAYRLDEVWLSS